MAQVEPFRFQGGRQTGADARCGLRRLRVEIGRPLRPGDAASSAGSGSVWRLLDAEATRFRKRSVALLCQAPGRALGTKVDEPPTLPLKLTAQ